MADWQFSVLLARRSLMYTDERVQFGIHFMAFVEQWLSEQTP